MSDTAVSPSRKVQGLFQQLHISLQAEQADHKAHAPHAAPLSPQIYGLGVQQRVESIRANAMALSRGGSNVVRDPSLMECTFRPQTNFSLRRKPRPGSAPKQQPLPAAAFDLSEYEDLLARYATWRLLMWYCHACWCYRVSSLQVLVCSPAKEALCMSFKQSCDWQKCGPVGTCISRCS